MATTRTLLLALVAVLAGPRSGVLADALIVSRAMKAASIAEVYVEEDGVRVELAIGVADLNAFRNLMPDEIYRKLGHPPRPIGERLAEFFGKEWLVAADDDLLQGRVTKMEPRPRIVRDEVTGDPLPNQPVDAEVTIYVEFTYALKERPKVLTLGARLQGASVGFVVYHRGVAVNDFRYLTPEATLDLDWDDPWYSSFRRRALWRRFKAPMSGFIYVDGFEVRKEIICRPKDLQHWIDLGIEGKDVIPAADQPAIKQKVAEFLAKHHPVAIDGKPATMTLDRIHFVRRTLRRTGVVDPPEDLPSISAMLGVIFITPTADLPQEVTMEWDLFNERVQQVPTVATDEAGGLPWTVSPDDPVLKWTNFLKNPSSRTLVDVAPPPGRPMLPIPVVSVACALLLLAMVALGLRGDAAARKRHLVLAFVLAAAAAAVWPFARVTVANPLAGPARLSDDDARTVVNGLLRNVYRAFDYREESHIYDVLERSVEGDLLTDIYLETQRALELQNQGGARAKVKEIEIAEAEMAPLADEVGFVSRCTWNVSGSIGHWGHIHMRKNQYQAELTVKPVEGVWKITSLELLSEQRL